MEPESPHNESSAPKDLLLELNFVPTWARQPAAKNPYAHFEGGGERYRRDDRGGRSSYDRGDDRQRSPRRDRRPGDRPGRPGEAGDSRFAPRPAPQTAASVETPVAERVQVDIAFIPERNSLGSVVREIRQTARAYPLFDLAARFLANPACYLVKIETRSSRERQKTASLFQCKECKIVFQNRGDLLAHILKVHLGLCFKVEEIVAEAPAGNFLFVARCKRSGELLGPPNYHGYNERLTEWHRTRFPNLTLDEYRNQIETVRDPELIEKWKEQARRQTVYRRVGAPETEPPLKREEAEREFMEKHAPGLVAEVRRVILPADVVQKLEDPFLKRLIRTVWENESRHPFTLAMALRPAFHHMRLNLFKANGRVTFVTAIRPYPLDPRHTVDTIGEVLLFLHDHPGCTRQEMVTQLRPGLAADAPEINTLISPLRWLIEKGHVIEFFDGKLSVPMASPPPRPAAPSTPRVPPTV